MGFYRDGKKNGFGKLKKGNEVLLTYWQNGVQNGLACHKSEKKEKFCIYKNGKVIKKFDSRENKELLLSIEKDKFKKAFFMSYLEINSI